MDDIATTKQRTTKQSTYLTRHPAMRLRNQTVSLQWACPDTSLVTFHKSSPNPHPHSSFSHPTGFFFHIQASITLRIFFTHNSPSQSMECLGSIHSLSSNHQDSMTCTKICGDYFTAFGIKTKLYFQWIWIMNENNSVKCVWVSAKLVCEMKDSFTVALHSPNVRAVHGDGQWPLKNSRNSHQSCEPKIHCNWGNPKLFLDQPITKGCCQHCLTSRWQSYCHQAKTV